MTEENEILEEIYRKEREIIGKKNYLLAHDYMTIREMQGGEPMPAAVKKACADARREINAREAEIAALREELEKMAETDVREPRMEEEEAADGENARE